MVIISSITAVGKFEYLATHVYEGVLSFCLSLSEWPLLRHKKVTPLHQPALPLQMPTPSLSEKNCWTHFVLFHLMMKAVLRHCLVFSEPHNSLIPIATDDCTALGRNTQKLASRAHNTKHLQYVTLCPGVIQEMFWKWHWEQCCRM